MSDGPSDTFRRLAARHPDQVGKVGKWAEFDGYEIGVVDIGRSYRWALSLKGRHVESDEAMFVHVAWQHACNALDRHAAALLRADC